jgi:cytochrome P450
VGYKYIGGLQDPYPVLAEMRETDPVFRMKDGWLVSSYDLVNAVVRDQKSWLNSHVTFGTPETVPYIIDPKQGNWSQVFGTMVNFVDGQQHRRLRQMVAPLFTPRGVEQFRTRVKEAIESQLDEAMAKTPGSMNLKDDFAFPMPTRVILEIFGLPQEESYRFYELADLIMPPPHRASPAEWFEHADEISDRHFDYILAEAEARRKEATDDLLTRIAGPAPDGDQLTDTELLGMVAFFVAAGYETTASTVTNGVHLLLRHPDQFQMLREDRSLLPSAIEELLRYEGPSRNAAPRFAAADTELGGVEIKMGEMIWPAVAAANRDPAHFDEPERFDITRTPNDHLAFSAGPHFCLGRPLARMEIEVGLEAMLDRLPATLREDGPAEWEDSLVIRKMKSLPVAW